MADLKETDADGIQVRRAASNPRDVIRKQEYDADIADRPTSTAVTAAIASETHAAVTVSDTDTVDLSLTTQALSASVRLSDGLTSTVSGVAVDFGSGATQVAAGNHSHANDHVAATGGATNTVTVTVTGQAITAAANLDPAGNLTSSSSGIAVSSGAFSAAGHTHTGATSGDAGFMSAADKVILDALAGASVKTFDDTATVTLTDTAGVITADVVAGTGLRVGSAALEIDTDVVLTRNSYARHYADASNVTTGETDLYSDTIAANTLNANGQSLQVEYSGVFINSTSAKQVKVYFGGTAIFATGALTTSAATSWVIRGTILRDTSTTIRYAFTATLTGASAGQVAASGKLTSLSFAGTNILKITGQASSTGAASNDITAYAASVDWWP